MKRLKLWLTILSKEIDQSQPYDRTGVFSCSNLPSLSGTLYLIPSINFDTPLPLTGNVEGDWNVVVVLKLI